MEEQQQGRLAWIQSELYRIDTELGLVQSMQLSLADRKQVLGEKKRLLLSEEAALEEESMTKQTEDQFPLWEEFNCSRCPSQEIPADSELRALCEEMESAKADMSAAQDTVCRKQALYHELGSVVGQSTDPMVMYGSCDELLPSTKSPGIHSQLESMAPFPAAMADLQQQISVLCSEVRSRFSPAIMRCEQTLNDMTERFLNLEEETTWIGLRLQQAEEKTVSLCKQPTDQSLAETDSQSID